MKQLLLLFGTMLIGSLSSFAESNHLREQFIGKWHAIRLEIGLKQGGENNALYTGLSERSLSISTQGYEERYVHDAELLKKWCTETPWGVRLHVSNLNYPEHEQFLVTETTMGIPRDGQHDLGIIESHKSSDPNQISAKVTFRGNGYEAWTVLETLSDSFIRVRDRDIYGGNHLIIYVDSSKADNLCDYALEEL